MNSYDDIRLETVRSLNSAVLNNAFTKLYDNDVKIAPAYDYIPNIWENKWYNDEVIPGYSRGYCVWKNVYADLSSFLNDYGDVVHQYAQQNDMLKDVITVKWNEVSSLSSIQQKQFWAQSYMNVVSGYSKQTSTSLTLNDNVRYIKISFTNASTLSGVKIYGLKFCNKDDHSLEYEYSTCYFSMSGITISGDIKNIISDTSSYAPQFTIPDSNTTEKSIIIDFGRTSLSLKQHRKVTICTTDASVINTMTIYASADGEDYAQIVASSQLKHSGTSYGYSAQAVIRNISKRIQYMQPLFEYGPLVISSATPHIKPLIELYVSTVDDNKELLSNLTAWNHIVLSSQAAYEAFIKSEVDMLFADHMKRYHLYGMLSNAAEVDAMLLSRDLSNFSIDDVQTKLKVASHDAFINADGFDYVVKSSMKHDSVTDKSDIGQHYIFRWYRLWNSGYLEHGGTVQCMPTSTSSSASDYYISVDLTWGGDPDVPVYNYTETSSSDSDAFHSRLYYGNDWPKEVISPNEMLLRGQRYSVSITPVQFDYDRDIRSGKYAPLSSLSSYSYPNKPLRNKVSSYVTTEVHHMKNSSFCFTKSNTDDLMSDSVMQMYTYRTTGFITQDESI